MRKTGVTTHSAMEVARLALTRVFPIPIGNRTPTRHQHYHHHLHPEYDLRKLVEVGCFDWDPDLPRVLHYRTKPIAEAKAEAHRILRSLFWRTVRHLASMGLLSIDILYSRLQH